VGFDFEDSERAEKDYDRQRCKQCGEPRVAQGIVDLRPGHGRQITLINSSNQQQFSSRVSEPLEKNKGASHPFPLVLIGRHTTESVVTFQSSFFLPSLDALVPPQLADTLCVFEVSAHL